MSQRARLFLAVLLVVCLRPLQADDPGCPDAELFSGKLITDICWGCLFPIRIAGLSIGGGDRPAAASNQVVCACNDGLGIPHPGFVVSLWKPARIVELTRAPACSPALGGIRLPLGSRRLLGTAGKSEWDASDISFYNYHWYAFPLLTLLDLFFEDRCNVDGMVDFDILYLSELDPTWNSGELAFFTNLEDVTAPGIAITRQVVEAIRDMPTSEQGLIIGRLVSEISTARTVEKALYARRLLLTGRQVPEVYATEVAREHAQHSIEELDREIDSLLFETRVRKEVVSDTVATLLKRAAARRNASMTVPQASPIDPRPLTNGRVQ